MPNDYDLDLYHDDEPAEVAAAQPHDPALNLTLADVAVDEVSAVQASTEDLYINFDEDGDGSTSFDPQQGTLRETECSFITGCAGSGKSYTLRQRIAEDASYAVLAATTGISAINLNAATIHSLLGFRDTDSLRDAYISGSAQGKLKKIVGEGYKNVVIDEVSMLSHEALDLIVKIFDNVNQNLAYREKTIGLILTGDFCQLPAIPDKPRVPGSKVKMPTPWAFDAQSWKRFDKNTLKLTKVWRQSDERYLAALNYARQGKGDMAAGALVSAGVTFAGTSDSNFDGTTIVGKNEQVDRFNEASLMKLPGRLIGLPSRRWGRERSEWKNIPVQTKIREGAYVMLLVNKYNGFQDLEYANGDCGHVRGIQPSQNGAPPQVMVELARNNRIVYVSAIIRAVETKDKPDDMTGEIDINLRDDVGGYIPQAHYRCNARKYVSGQLEYFPIRLAYATTCHKAQGLSLDRVQIDMRDWMMKSPAMTYVSLSRCRTIEGLRIIGRPDDVRDKCRIDPRVLRWL